MSNVIKQIVNGSGDTQTIKMIVRDNERGPQGEQGEPGVAATITAGNAYSVPGTSNPSVVNTGTSTDAVFDFYIPKGSAGWGDIDGNIQDQADLKPYLDKADTALQPQSIDQTVMSDLEVNANTSTNVLQLDASKVNLLSGASTTKNIPLPVASSTRAGVMNSATFDAVANNSATLNVILNGSVAVAGLPLSPAQAELTTAWQTASGLVDLVNRAQILDVDNSRYWVYYTNTSTWYSGSADIQVTVSTFTNSSEGTIKGSTSVGQVFAESDGTGSVNGWDSLSAQVEDNTANKLAAAKLTSSNGITKTTTGSGASTAVNLSLTDGGVSTAKLANNSVTNDKLNWGTIRKSLFSGTTAGNVSLSGDASLYSYFVIQFYRTGYPDTFNTAVVYAPNGRGETLMTSQSQGGTITFYTNKIYISGTTILRGASDNIAFNPTGVVGYSTDNEIIITEVIGFA